MTTRNLITIANHPVLNLTRKAQVFRSSKEYDTNRVILKIKVFHYDDNNELVTYLKNDIAELIADNSVLVNPANGQIVDSTFEGSMGEYDYLWQVVNVAKAYTESELEEIYIGLRIDKINLKLYGI